MSPIASLSADLDRLLQAWRLFTQDGQLAPDLNPLVAQSWQRCAPRLNPQADPYFAALSDEVLKMALRRNHALVAVARPILEDLYQYLEHAQVMLTLVDSTMCVLDYLGDPEVVAWLEGRGIKRGVYLHEGRLGTIAFSSALLDGSAAQMTGAEHFLACLHDLTTAAAPIFALDGHAVGAVGLIAPASRHHPYAVAMALAAARAVENQLHADALTAEANARATELNITLDAASDAVLVWDNLGHITHVNEAAGHLLGLKPAAVMGRPVAEHLVLPEALARAVAVGEDVREAELVFKVAGQPVVCLTSLRVIRDQAAGPINNFVVTLRQMAQVHQLVNRFVGAQARLTLSDLIGESAAARRVRRQAVAAADARACLLIQGEAGTGKNALARAIHNSSRRADGPFLSVNCRAVPRELVLGEFLGYEAGAFNMAAGQPSKFELAHGGTLFLDEIDVLPLEMQAALLRVIEAGDVIRLGGKRVIPVEVRLIAASHQPLEERVAEGSFRSDLLFRLSSFVITMPPLRECAEDIPLLVDRLRERLKLQIGCNIHLTPEALAALQAYAWPGNIRELEAVLERAALASDGEPITLAALPVAIRERRALARGKTGQLAQPVRTLEETERLAIVSAYRATQGNLTKTAALLGIGRTTLWRKMKDMRITTVEDV